MTYSPVNTKTVISAEMTEKVISGSKLEDLVRYDPSEMAANKAAWLKQWNEAITQ